MVLDSKKARPQQVRPHSVLNTVLEGHLISTEHAGFDYVGPYRDIRQRQG